MKKALIAALAMLACLIADGATFFSQAHNGSGSLYQSSVNGSDYDQLTWDNFHVTNAATITEMRWRGGYRYGGLYNGTVTNWTIAIYRNVATANEPDLFTPPFETYTISGNAGETFGGNFGGTAMYDYSFVLPNPFPLAVGTNYWLLIQANQPGIPEWGFAMGSGDSRCFRRVAAAADWWFYLAGADLAFSLIGSDGATVSISGSVLPAGTGEIIGAGDYPVGSSALVTARPMANYGFVGWTQNGTVVSTSAGYQFTASSNRTLVANFTPRYSVTVGASPNYGGTVTGGGTFNSNSVVNVIAIPASGYSFVNWTEFGGEVSTSDSFTFNIADNRNLVANFVASSATATFDFDTGMPPVYPHQGMPASQWNNGLAAYFSTLSGGWSVQNDFYYWVPGVFSGNFLYPSTWGSTLAIEFSRPVTNFSMAFFTGDVSSEYDIPTKVRVTAYTDSTMTNPVASKIAQGDWLTGAYPEGSMSFGSTTQFTKVKIDMPAGQGAVSYLYWVDNIVVQEVPLPPVTITTAVAPVGAGTATGDGTFANGDVVSLSAIPNAGYEFTNWTQNGVEVCIWPDYFFAATSNCTVVANFIPLPPTSVIVASALPSNGGTTTGEGVLTNGTTASLTAIPNSGFDFVNWTENGSPACASAGYSFTVTTNRLLVANFAAAVIPEVAIQSSAGALVLSWPTNSVGFGVEQCTNLVAGNWTAMTNLPAVVGTNHQVTITPSGDNCFYRLVHP